MKTLKRFLSVVFACIICAACENIENGLVPKLSYDLEKPVIELVTVSPQSGVTFGSTITLDASVTDNQELKSVSVILQDDAGSVLDKKSYVSEDACYVLNTSLFVQWHLCSVEGEYRVVIRAEDKAGNIAENVVPVNVVTPEYHKLYVLVEQEEGFIEMMPDPLEEGLFVATAAFPAGAKIRIASKNDGTGIIWGCEQDKKMSLTSEDYADLKLTSAIDSYTIGFSLVDFTLRLPKIQVDSYYVIGPAHNINWTILGAELVGYSESGKRVWTAEDVELKAGEIKLIKAPGGVIDWETGLGYDDGAVSQSSSSTPMYLKVGGRYDITAEYDETIESFVSICFECNESKTVYSSIDGISVDNQVMPSLELGGTLLQSPTAIEYPYWFKPAEYYTLQNGATITVPSPASLAGMTADERYFKIEGNTITYVGPSGQRWTLNMSLRDKFLRMELPDRTMVAPDALWMTGANFRDAGSTGAYINWNTHLILRRVSEYSYECNVAIQNLNQTNPALFRIVGADGAAGWGLDTYQPVHFATPYPEAITDGGGGNFQSVDYGGVYRLTVDLSEGSGNYKMSFEKQGNN